MSGRVEFLFPGTWKNDGGKQVWQLKKGGGNKSKFYCSCNCITNFQPAPLHDSIHYYSKTCVKRPLSKRPQIDFQDQLLLNAGQKYCRMLPLEHSAMLSTFIKLPYFTKI